MMKTIVPLLIVVLSVAFWMWVATLLGISLQSAGVLFLLMLVPVAIAVILLAREGEENG